MELGDDALDTLDAYGRAIRTAQETLSDDEQLRRVVRALVARVAGEWPQEVELVGPAA